MSSPLTFRAWHKKKKFMFNPDSVGQGGKWVIFKHEEGEDRYVSDQVEIMKSTGLTDKNGKMIYAGDIVKFRDVEFDVVWCNGAFKLMERASMLSLVIGDQWLCDLISPVCFCNKRQPIEKFEVVGNIYESHS